MLLILVGNVPYCGYGPLKYANAEIAGADVKCSDAAKTVENGSEVALRPGARCEILVPLLNTGEARWVAAHSRLQSGDCVFRTGAGHVPVREDVPRYTSTMIGTIRVEVGRHPIEVSGRLLAHERGAFGEALRLRLAPEKMSQQGGSGEQ